MSGGSFVDFSLIWILMKFLQPYLDLLVTYFYFNRCQGKLLYNLYAKWGPLGAEQQGFFVLKLYSILLPTVNKARCIKPTAAAVILGT